MIFEPTAPNLNPFIKLYPYNKFFSRINRDIDTMRISVTVIFCLFIVSGGSFTSILGFTPGFLRWHNASVTNKISSKYNRSI